MLTAYDYDVFFYLGQWQNYPISAQNQMMFSTQAPTPNMGSLPNLNMPPPQLQTPKAVPNYPYSQQIPIATSLNGGVTQLPTSMGMTGQIPPPQPSSVPQLHIQGAPQASMAQMHIQQQVPNLTNSVAQINSMQGIPGALPQNIPTHPQVCNNKRSK